MARLTHLLCSMSKWRISKASRSTQQVARIGRLKAKHSYCKLRPLTAKAAIQQDAHNEKFVSWRKQTTSILKSIGLIISRLGQTASFQCIFHTYNLLHIILKNFNSSPVVVENISTVVECSLLTLRFLLLPVLPISSPCFCLNTRPAVGSLKDCWFRREMCTREQTKQPQSE